jgi:uncharacterized membrane protein (DUF373 family)
MAEQKAKTYYDQLKKIIIFILMGMLLLVVFVSIVFLAWNLIDMIFLHFNQGNFQTTVINLFGLFFLVLVGIELLETLQMYTKERVVHVEVVLLVALIVAARKIILIDYATTSTDVFFGIAAVVVSIGVTYFLLKKASTEKRVKSQ